MSATPFSLKAPKSYSRLGSCRGWAAGAPPGLEGDPSRQPEDQEGDDRVEDPDRSDALAAPREDDLHDREQREHNGHHHSPPPEPRAEREQEEENGPQEDDVAEAIVETEAVIELVLREARI